jgi:hypothetical protein
MLRVLESLILCIFGLFRCCFLIEVFVPHFVFSVWQEDFACETNVLLCIGRPSFFLILAVLFCVVDKMRSFSVDLSRKPWEQTPPLHNRWHPGIG